jgi:hypothetical protein
MSVSRCIISNVAFILVLVFCLLVHVSTAFTVISPKSGILQTYDAAIAKLKQETVAIVGTDRIVQEPFCNDIFYLRYCLDAMDKQESDEGMKSLVSAASIKLKEALKWRQHGVGLAISMAAAKAVFDATSNPDVAWNNAPVLAAAPYSAIIGKYITAVNCRTTTTAIKHEPNHDAHLDLLYCIRAGAINDQALMSAVSVDQLAEYFLYVKEVNSIVANQRSLINVKAGNGRLVKIVTVNDLNDVKLIGGGEGAIEFRQALAAASKVANSVYPDSLVGPTLLLNLPPLVSFLVKLFTPLFPPAVKARIKFETCDVLKNVRSLSEVCDTHSPKRKDFLEQVNRLLTSG